MRMASKSIDLIGKKKNKFTRVAHFFVHFFAVVLKDKNVKRPRYTLFFMEEFVICAHQIFFACVAVRLYFFTAAHFPLAGR